MLCVLGHDSRYIFPGMLARSGDGTDATALEWAAVKIAAALKLVRGEAECTCPAPFKDERFCAWHDSSRPEVRHVEDQPDTELPLRYTGDVCTCVCHDGNRTPEGAW